MNINLGSGQRRFGEGWVNIDCVSRPGEVPDLIADGRALPFPDGSADSVVLHHVLEHFGCGDGGSLLRESHRVLKAGGSLFVFVPNLRALAERWLASEISDWIYTINLYGAYHGEEGDRHRWGWSPQSIVPELARAAPWASVKRFDWRALPGGAVARDWWILGMECVK